VRPRLAARNPRRLGALLCGLLIGVGFAAQAGAMQAGDAAWRDRAEGAVEGRPQREPIFDSIRAYEQALAADPSDLEARWKLLRSLHFAGEFTLRDEVEQQALFERARNTAEAGLDRLAERLGGSERFEQASDAARGERLAATGTNPEDVARLYFWSAINWGAWSRTVGILTAVRTGVANRVYGYASIAAELEPGYEEGGAFRLLGSLHAGLPRIPFLTGWVDRDESIRLLAHAYDMAPSHPGNALLLADTLLEVEPERREEAIALLAGIDSLPVREDMRVEDFAIREQARERLAAARAETGS